MQTCLSRFYLFPFFFIALLIPAFASSATFLKDRLHIAHPGDYIVTAIDNTYTIVLVKESFENQLTLEEISVPIKKLEDNNFSWQGWKHWVENGAKENSSWAVYTVYTPTGHIRGYFSYTKNSWCNMSEADNFLSTLLNLRFAKVSLDDRRKAGTAPPPGAPDKRPVWSPPMVFEGKLIPNVPFDAWRTRWPHDKTDLSGKLITVYLPQEEKKYPTYFPYWLEIQGFLGKAKVRIIDAGRGIHSRRNPPSRQIP